MSAAPRTATSLRSYGLKPTPDNKRLLNELINASLSVPRLRTTRVQPDRRTVFRKPVKVVMTSLAMSLRGGTHKNLYQFNQMLNSTSNNISLSSETKKRIVERLYTRLHNAASKSTPTTTRTQTQTARATLLAEAKTNATASPPRRRKAAAARRLTRLRLRHVQSKPSSTVLKTRMAIGAMMPKSNLVCSHRLDLQKL
jgi:hypothetical protein